MHKQTLKKRSLTGASLFQAVFALVFLFSLLGVQPAAAVPSATPLEAPSAQGGAPITFAIISDFGTGPGAGPTANMVHNWNPAFIITAGDNHQGTNISEGAYEQVVGAYYGATAGAGRNYVGDGKFWPVPGNHDYMVGINYYTDYFNYLPPSDSSPGSTDLYYDIVRGPVHFFMLNSGNMIFGGGATVPDQEAQKAFLQQGLAASTSPWKIVVFHIPAASAGAHGSSTEMQWDFASWGADFVIAAHNHIYERIEWNDIVYFTTGAGGNNARSNYDENKLPSGAVTKKSLIEPDANGATKVTASNTEIKFEFFSNSDTDNPKDTYTQTREVPPLYAWEAYNDCVTTNATNPEGTTTIQCYKNESGKLKNFDTAGTELDVTATIVTSGSVDSQTGSSLEGAIPSEGTDAYNLFNDKASVLGGVRLYNSTNSKVTLTITGLNPEKTYTFATTANRGDSSYTTRKSGFELSDIDSAINASSVGTTINGLFTKFWTGYNTETGYIARWENISPGLDGGFVVTFTNQSDDNDTTAYGPAVFYLAEEIGDAETFTLTATGDGNGSVSLSPTGGSYAEGTTVTLTPVPNPGFTFSHWTGADAEDIVSSGGKYTIVMNGDKSVTANFMVSLCTDVSVVASADTYMSTYNHTYNYGGDVKVRVTPGTYPRGGLIKFDLSSVVLPEQAQITDANLQFYVDEEGSGSTFSLYAMRQAWVEGTKTGAASADGATWDTYDGTNDWETAGAASTSSDRYNDNLWVADSNSFSSTGIKNIALNDKGKEVVQGWLEQPSQNHGFTIQNYGTGSTDIYLASKENTSGYAVPTLNITYCVASPPAEAAIDKAVDKAEAAINDTLTYTISGIGYDGASLLTDVTVTDAIPEGTVYVADSASPAATFDNGVLTWNLGSNSVGLPGEVTEGGGTADITVVSQSNGSANYASNLTFSHTPGAGSDRLLLVGVSWGNNSSTYDIGTVTFRGKALTEAGHVYNGSKQRTAIYALQESDIGSGAGDIVITIPDDKSSTIVAGAVTLSGVDQTNPLGLFASNTGSSSSASVSFPINADEIGFSVINGGASKLTKAEEQIEHWNTVENYYFNVGGAGSTKPAPSGGGDLTMSWALGSSATWAIAAVPVKPGVGSTTRTTTLTAANSLVSTGDTVTVEATFTNTAANNDIAPDTLQVSGTGGAGCINISGPTLKSADKNISGPGDPVVYKWTCDAVAGTSLPSSLTFSVTGTGEGNVNYNIGTSNSVLVVPELAFEVIVDETAGDEIENVAVLNSSSFESKESNLVTTTVEEAPIPPEQYTLTVTVVGSGTVPLGPSDGPYDAGTVVTLTPVPATDYLFDGWSGTNASEIVDTEGVYTIIMNGNKTVTAAFTKEDDKFQYFIPLFFR